MLTIPQSLLDEAVRRLVEAFNPEAILLFGSHAWGVPREDSDLDVLVIITESDERPIRRAQRAHACLRGLKAPMDLLIRTRAEVDRFVGVPASLEAEILERGKVIYGRREAGDRPGLAHEGVA